MSNYPQYLLSSTIGSKGDYVIPPTTSDSAGDGRLSQEEGWTQINQTPLEEGGIAPFRVDMNGILFLLSQFSLWYQQGGIMKYSSTLAYEVGNEVFHNGTKYRALQANGGSVPGVTPGTNPLVWKNMDHNVPAGAVMPFFNVLMGSGQNSRNPIFWGETQPDESWVICDGGSDGNNGSVPNLIDKFIMGSNVSEVGQTGGSSTQTLTSNQLPAHTHTITVQSAGSHKHSRGTMNITGTFFGERGSIYAGTFSGAFSAGTQSGYAGIADSDYDNYLTNFNAANGWTGSTSSDGSHTHVANCSSTGSASASVSTLPPFFKMAYFIKLPEA